MNQIKIVLEILKTSLHANLLIDGKEPVSVVFQLLSSQNFKTYAVGYLLIGDREFYGHVSCNPLGHMTGYIDCREFGLMRLDGIIDYNNDPSLIDVICSDIFDYSLFDAVPNAAADSAP
jgi:hypothetical protein